MGKEEQREREQEAEGRAKTSIEELRRGLRYYLLDGIGSKIMGTLTGGAFLVGLALLLGASDLVVGLLASLPFVSRIMLIPATWLVEKVRRRKLICGVSNLISRPILLLIGLAPLFLPYESALDLLLLGLLGYSIIATFSSLSWNVWMRDLIPERIRGRIIAQRLVVIGWVGLPLSLLAALFLDWWKAHLGPGPAPFALLFGLGAAAGIAGVYFMLKIPEPPPPPRESVPLFRLLALPLEDRNFRALILFTTWWAFATNLALPFITVYMLKLLQLPYIYVLSLSAVSQLANISFLRIWGRIADRFGNKAVLWLCSPIFSISLLLWVFTVKADPLVTLSLITFIHLINGLATAGLSLGQYNILLKLSPAERSPAYLAAASLANSLAAGIAPILGGLLANFFVDKELLLSLTWISRSHRWQISPFRLYHLDFLFLLAFLLGIAALHPLRRVKEVEREAPRDVVLKAVREEIQNVSTIKGMRYLTHAASYLATLILGMGRLIAREAPEKRER
jgi:MFS family permease